MLDYLRVRPKRIGTIEIGEVITWGSDRHFDLHQA